MVADTHFRLAMKQREPWTTDELATWLALLRIVFETTNDQEPLKSHQVVIDGAGTAFPRELYEQRLKLFSLK